MKAKIKSINNLVMIVILCISFFFTGNVYAKDWPEPVNEPVGKAVILMDADTGAVLYAKNVDEQLYPASITKIMTCLLAIENLNLDDTIMFTSASLSTLPDDAATQGVVAGEIMTVKDCLYSLMLRSSNDIAVTLAYEIAGSEREFAEMMTERAHELGAVNTNFANSTGLHDVNHYTTARDMALITQAAVSNPTFQEIWSTWEYTLPETNKESAQRIVHRNYLLLPNSINYYEYAIGGKTGYTDEAGRTLVTYASKDGLNLISVIMFSDLDHIWDDTKDLMNFGFNNFKKVSISSNETRFGQGGASGITLINEIYGNDSSMLTVGDGSVVIPKDSELSSITYNINYDIEDTGKGEVAGITYVHDGYELGTATLYMSSIYNNNETAVSSIKREETVKEKADIKEVFSINIFTILKILILLVIIGFLLRKYIVWMHYRKIGKKYYTSGRGRKSSRSKKIKYTIRD